MTAIVGVAQDGYVTIGGDSAGVSSTTLQSTVRGDPKVFANGEFIIGFTTSFRMGQILQHELKFDQPPRHPSVEEMDHYMVTKFVKRVREAFNGTGWGHQSGGREDGGTFLVGWRGFLYGIQSDFQIARSEDGYMAAGIGDAYALGVLFATRNTDTPPADRVLLALAAAHHHNGGVRPPFRLLSTRPGA